MEKVLHFNVWAYFFFCICEYVLRLCLKAVMLVKLKYLCTKAKKHKIMKRYMQRNQNQYLFISTMFHVSQLIASDFDLRSAISRPKQGVLHLVELVIHK